jgi:hypothetical protein
VAPVTPATPDGRNPAGGWGHNVGGFMRHYRDWVIQGSAAGFTARRRGPNGRPRGPVIQAPTLDDLAALIETARQRPPSG